MYREWLYAKHTVYYDKLPHYFLAFDIFDRQEESFLSIDRRREMLRDLPVVSVSVLAEGTFRTKQELVSLLVPSNYISDEKTETLRQTCEKLGLDPERQCRETVASNLMEGLYIKIEENGQISAEKARR